MQLSAVAPKPLPASTYPPMNTSEEIEGVLLTNHKFDVFGDDIIGEVVAPLYAGSIGTGPLSGTGITRAEGTFDDAVVAAASLSSGSRTNANHRTGSQAVGIVQTTDGTNWLVPLVGVRGSTDFMVDAANMNPAFGDSQTYDRANPALQAVVSGSQVADLREVAVGMSA